MTTQYTSIHSGVDIDRAVSYYKSLDTYGRTILSVPIAGGDEGNWKDVSTDNPVVGNNSSKYYIKITLTGSYKLGGAPLVYFVDNNGQQWYIDHIFKPLSTEGSFDPSNIQDIYCLSNTKISGAVIIICNLTDIKTINEDGTESSISASYDDEGNTESNASESV